MTITALRSLVIVLALVLAPPASLQAQQPEPDSVLAVTLRGFVRDTAGRSLPGAEVRLGARFTVTDDSGAFLLGGLAPDTVELSVRRFGFQPVFTAFVIAPGHRVDLAVRMTPSTVTLGEIVIEGRRMDARLWKSGYYDRKKISSGTFFDPSYLEHHGGSMTSLLREARGVEMAPAKWGIHIATGRSPGGRCQLNVFLDGTRITWANDAGIDNIVSKQDVLAVEVYPSATSMPSRILGFSQTSTGSSLLASPVSTPMDGSLADCGAILIWTKPI